jgi:hypothetical protein
MSIGTLSLAAYLARAMPVAHPWGVLEVMAPVRYGWRRFRLTVYPPGTTTTGRRLLWVDRHIPVIAAIVVLAAMVILQPDVPPLSMLLAIPPGVILVATVRRVTKPLRAGVRTLAVAHVDVSGRTETLGDGPLLSRCVDELQDIDRARCTRQIDPIEYERRWAGVYESIGLS